MQISGVNGSGDSEKWAVAAQSNTVSSSVDTGMATESDIAVKAVTDSKNKDNIKTSADKSQDLKNKDKHDNKDNTNSTDSTKKEANEPDNTQLKFKVHKGTGEIMIQVVDNDTGKVIREIPPENLLDAIAKIWKTAGINLDKKI